jgi:hypothetical protein
MKPRTFVTLAAVTGIAVIAATTAATLHSGQNARATAGEAFLPAVAEDMSAIAGITLQDNEHKVSAVRRDGKWFLTGDLEGYPASVAEIRELLVGLADLRRLEPKTALPDRFVKLQVNDVTDEEALGKRVTLTGQGGEQIADLIVGKAWFGQVGLDKSGRYVRSLDEDRAWLALGDLAVGARVKNMVETRIVPELSQADIRRVTVTQPDGSEVVVERQKPMQQFTLLDMPEGRELRTPQITGSFANAMESMRLDNILPASEAPIEDGKAVTLAVETFDNETVILRVQGDDEAKRYFVAVEGLHKAGREADEKAGLNRADWRYLIPNWRYDDLTKTMEDMLVTPSS